MKKFILQISVACTTADSIPEILEIHRYGCLMSFVFVPAESKLYLVFGFDAVEVFSSALDAVTEYSGISAIPTVEHIQMNHENASQVR